VLRQQRIRCLRHIIRELAQHIPEKDRRTEARREAGYADTRRALDDELWSRITDTMDGVLIHGATP
jgi:hypothetical protein